MSIHLRPAKPGDFCVLLAPLEEDTPKVDVRQEQLRTRCGGRPARPVHLTCQRFAAGPEALESFLELMRAIALACDPIPVNATALIKWHPGGQTERNLRWGIALTPPIRAFGSMLERVLAASGAAQLYIAGWQPTMATALQGIDDISFDPNQLSPEPFPYELFVARRILITRILGNDEYRTEFDLTLGAI